MNESKKSVEKVRLMARMKRRQLLKGAGGAAVLATLGPAAVQSAELGGELNFIGWAGEDAATVAKPFLEANNIVVNPTYVGSADEPLTLFNTGGRGQMDIIAYNKDFGNTILNAGAELFSPLDMSRIPNAQGLFPALKNAEWVTRNGVVYGAPLIWGDEPLVYNPKRWDRMPAKYIDFADPVYRGELTMVDDPVANTWLWAKSLGFPLPASLTQAQLDQTIDKMLETKPNIVTFALGLGDQADILIRGDASIAIGGWAFQKVLAAKKGVELAIGLPAEDGTYFWADVYAIAVDSPNADNAYAFINYMMEPANNAAIATELGSGVTIEAAVGHLDAETKALYDYSIPADPNSVLGTQVVFPAAEDEGDIVGIQKWVEAWERFKLA